MYVDSYHNNSKITSETNSCICIYVYICINAWTYWMRYPLRDHCIQWDVKCSVLNTLWDAMLYTLLPTLTCLSLSSLPFALSPLVSLSLSLSLASSLSVSLSLSLYISVHMRMDEKRNLTICPISCHEVPRSYNIEQPITCRAVYFTIDEYVSIHTSIHTSVHASI